MCYRLTPPTLAASLVAAALAWLTLTDIIAQDRLIAWFTAITLISAARYALIRAYARAAPPPEEATRWLVPFIALTLAAGIAWGLLGTILYPPYGSPYQGMMGIFLIGLTAAGLFTLPILKAYLALALPLLGPFTLMLLTSDIREHWLLGIANLVFLVVAVVNARRAERNYAETLRLRFEVAAVAEQRERAMRTAEAASRAMSQFLARMSHEIRTPMNGVLGMAQLLMETPLDERQSNCLRALYRSGEGLLDVINDVLDFSKIEAGRLELEHIDFDLPARISDAIMPLRERARRKGLALQLEMAADLPRSVSGDPVRLSQVMSNLVSNAIKFTPAGRIDVRVTRGTDTDASGTQIHFSVTDTGVGVAAEALVRVFDAFAQADVSHTRKYGGTGLGLAIAKQLVELMGGTIGATSEAGRGSTFWFTLPLQAATGAEMPHRHLAEAVQTLAPQRGRVLLVEDNSINREVARAMLSSFGLEVTIARNGLEAVAALEGGEFDLILMDCEMPEMDGFEATRRIRARDHASAKVPIVALTAHAVAGDRERCIAAGMNDYIPKPFRREDLHAVLNRWLGSGEAGPAAQI